VKRGDRKGFPEQVKPHRLPDRLALFPVKLLLSAFRKLFPFRLQDPEPKKGRGNGFPVDAQGEENVSFPGVERVRGIGIRVIFQGSPPGRLFVCRTPDGPEGIASDPFFEEVEKGVRQCPGDAVTRKSDRSVQQSHSFSFANDPNPVVRGMSR